ncbi:unnamed protein product, partial [Ectocarpus sp. 8 AP-2014]
KETEGCKLCVLPTNERGGLGKLWKTLFSSRTGERVENILAGGPELAGRQNSQAGPAIGWSHVDRGAFSAGWHRESF